MAEKGKVIGKDDKFVLVSRKSTMACGKCRSCSSGDDNEEVRTRAENLCAADIGDFVELEMSHGAAAYASIIAYGIPLAAVLAGFAIGYYFGGEIAAFILGMVLLSAALGFVFMRERRRKNSRFIPKAIRKINVENGSEPFSD